MYVLVHKNRVLVGPMGWNRAIFDGNLEKLKILKTLPKNPPTELPMIIDENTKIYRADSQTPEHNEKIQYLEGPYWNITPETATATFLVKDKPIDPVKSQLKEFASQVRWEKETSGTTVTIQNVDLFISTQRIERDQYLQKYLLMSETDSLNWKFKESWLTINKQEIKTIVDAIQTHIQTAFDWEINKHQEIDQCTTLTELDQIVIRET